MSITVLIKHHSIGSRSRDMVRLIQNRLSWTVSRYHDCKLRSRTMCYFGCRLHNIMETNSTHILWQFCFSKKHFIDCKDWTSGMHVSYRELQWEYCSRCYVVCVSQMHYNCPLGFMSEINKEIASHGIRYTTVTQPCRPLDCTDQIGVWI